MPYDTGVQGSREYHVIRADLSRDLKRGGARLGDVYRNVMSMINSDKYRTSDARVFRSFLE